MPSGRVDGGPASDTSERARRTPSAPAQERRSPTTRRARGRAGGSATAPVENWPIPAVKRPPLRRRLGRHRRQSAQRIETSPTLIKRSLLIDRIDLRVWPTGPSCGYRNIIAARSKLTQRPWRPSGACLPAFGWLPRARDTAKNATSPSREKGFKRGDAGVVGC